MTSNTGIGLKHYLQRLLYVPEFHFQAKKNNEMFNLNQRLNSKDLDAPEISEEESSEEIMIETNIIINNGIPETEKSEKIIQFQSMCDLPSVKSNHEFSFDQHDSSNSSIHDSDEIIEGEDHQQKGFVQRGQVFDESRIFGPQADDFDDSQVERCNILDFLDDSILENKEVSDFNKEHSENFRMEKTSPENLDLCNDDNCDQNEFNRRIPNPENVKECFNQNIGI